MNRENSAYDLVIIGGGFSGIITAISILEKAKNFKIAIIEKLDRIGKKILSTGNGQCNLSNVNSAFQNGHYHGKNAEFCTYSLEKYDHNSLIEFFNKLGVQITIIEDKIYPLSMQANSVLDALRFKLESLGVKVYNNTTAYKISKNNLGFKIFSKNQNEEIILTSSKVLLATGGKSSDHLGSDGSGYSLYESFGHKVTQTYPSICQLKTENVKGLKGLKQKATCYAYVGDKKVSEIYGDILFTDNGVSGNTIFYLSSYLVDKKDAYVLVDFCPTLSKEKLTEIIYEKIKNCPYIKIQNLLSSIVNNKIGERIIISALNVKINENTPTVNTLTKSQIDAIIYQSKNYKLKVVGNAGFKNSQVTKGGLNVLDFNEKTMESKLQKGLFATGEVLDIDGDCGGFNLQFAYSSSRVASQGILYDNAK